MEVSEETRLVRIIHKLETKLKAILLENAELKEKLELAHLDQQLAEEQSHQFESQLKDLTARIQELEELNVLNGELEESYLSEKSRLESQITELQIKLESLSQYTQSVESLKLELKRSESKLRFAFIKINVLKSGYKTLSTEIGEANWLPLIDLLNIDVEQTMGLFFAGQISGPKVSDLLLESVRNAVNEPIMIDPSLEKQLRALNPSNELNSIWEHAVYPAVEPVICEKAPEPATDDLRIQILENKLSKAQVVVAELSALKKWQDGALQRENDLLRIIDQLKGEIEHKSNEFLAYKKTSLPSNLQDMIHMNKIRQLSSTVALLSFKRSGQILEPLEIVRQFRISCTAGNPRVKRLRKLAETFRTGSTPEDASNLAIEQDIKLMQI